MIYLSTQSRSTKADPGDTLSRTEHLAQAKKRQADLKIPALLQSNAALAEPVQIPGLMYHEVQVTGRRLERALIRQLSWWNFMYVVLCFHFKFNNRPLCLTSSISLILHTTHLSSLLHFQHPDTRPLYLPPYLTCLYIDTSSKKSYPNPDPRRYKTNTTH